MPSFAKRLAAAAVDAGPRPWLIWCSWYLQPELAGRISGVRKTEALTRDLQQTEAVRHAAREGASQLPRGNRATPPGEDLLQVVGNPGLDGWPPRRVGRLLRRRSPFLVAVAGFGTHDSLGGEPQTSHSDWTHPRDIIGAWNAARTLMVTRP